MTALNKQALREAAERATPGRIGDRIDGSGSIKYECHGYDGSLVLRTDHKNMEYGFIGENGNADEIFFRLCVPDVILALLDELEAAEKRGADMEVACELYSKSTLAQIKLQAALDKVQSANAAQGDHINQQQDRIDTLEKRNAELGREVIRLQSLKTVNVARQEAESEFHRGYSCGHKDASSESRTVTVKLPKLTVAEVMLLSGFDRQYAEGWCSGNDNAINEMKLAGIQVIEGEGK